MENERIEKDEIERIRKNEERLKIMNAYLEGKTIQCKGRHSDEWTDIPQRLSFSKESDYRIKPDEPRKLMTYGQLSELMQKGYGVWHEKGPLRYARSGNSFAFGEENMLAINALIRPWGSKDWIEPTVDIYEEYISKWNKAFKEIEVKVVFPKKEEKDTIKDYSYDYAGEPEVGEIFKISGRTLKCIEEKGCKGCAYLKGPSSCCPDIACSNAFRKDGKSVVFVDVSKMENTTASEDSSATVSKEETVGVLHKRTPQEIADFFNCYVAMDWNDAWYLYEYEPMLSYSAKKWFGKRGECTAFGSNVNSSAFLFIEISENSNWRTLYRPHQEPLVMEEEDD